MSEVSKYDIIEDLAKELKADEKIEQGIVLDVKVFTCDFEGGYLKFQPSASWFDEDTNEIVFDYSVFDKNTSYILVSHFTLKAHEASVESIRKEVSALKNGNYNT